MKNFYYDIKRRISNLFFYIRRLFNIPEPVDFKYVDIIFENCNTVRIPSRLINNIHIANIYKTIYTDGVQQLISFNFCKDFSITLNNDALKIKTSFQKACEDSQQDFQREFQQEFQQDSFEYHLYTYRDITGIVIKPSKGKKIHIIVPYKTDNESDSPNLLQKNIVSDTTCTICIKEE